MQGTKLTLCLVAIVLAACTASRPPIAREAIEDFVIANQLEEQKSLRTGRSDSWQALNSNYALYTARREIYLLEFERQCRSLEDNFDIEVDRRRDGYNLYARFDTLRGCFIDHIYPVTDVQATELKNLGDAPGENTY
jgi:hypothetical protein